MWYLSVAYVVEALGRAVAQNTTILKEESDFKFLPVSGGSGYRGKAANKLTERGMQVLARSDH